MKRSESPVPEPRTVSPGSRASPPTSATGSNGVAAATPQGLVDNHNITTLVTPDPANGLPGAYGPTIMTDHYDPVTHTDSVQMRVSQYGDPSMPKGPDGKWIYDPRTYTTTFTVGQPGGQ